ncbi:MAG TPA: hypothetical protein DD614_00430 [Clostridiales bacterium]|nr:hypothetical protein [Clostridiales bacterium]
MSKKSDLTKSFNKVIDDIMDNYDKYTTQEQTEIEQFFHSAETLNSKLEHYDKKPSLWEKFKKALSNFFGGKK